MRAAYADIDGVRLRYLYAGEGPALFLLHGVGLSGDCFLRNIEGLAGNFSVFAPDLPGHGFSDVEHYGNEAAQVRMARRIARFADHLKIDSYAIAGSSFGALVAALTYFHRPEQVRSLALLGSGSVFHPPEKQKLTLQAAAANGETAMKNATLETCRLRVGAIVHDPACIPPEMVWLQLTSYARQDRLTAYRETIGNSIAHADDPASRVLDRLEQIACPTLIVVGREDIRADWRHHEQGAARIPDCKLLIYERCGHLPFLEYPERFNAEFSQFLNRNAAPRAREAAVNAH